MRMQEYVILIEDAGENYSAYSPDVDGVVATGRTRAECIEQMREALTFHLESLAEHGDPVPPPALTAATVVVPDVRARPQAS